MATNVPAEHVGSLLRPRWLPEARAAHKQGTLTSAGLRAAEDRAVLEAWMASGSYEPVAERLFGEVGVDRFLLEYDTERAGGFEP